MTTSTAHLILFLLAPAIALALGVPSVLAAIRLGRSWGIVDRPDARKIHSGTPARTGGVGLAVAAILTAAGAFALAALWGHGLTGAASWATWVVFAAAAAAILAVGVADDAVSLPGHYKLLALVAAALALCGTGLRIDAVHLNTGDATLSLGLLAWPVTVLWVCGVTVAIAFCDGLDGLAGGVSLVCAGVIAAAAVAAGQADVAVAALCLAGGIAAFLCFNNPWGGPARVFMGDGGTMFLGFALASLAVVLNGREGVGSMRALVLPAAALGVPILDTALTLVRRKVLQRRSLFAAEDGHVHHRLLAIGLAPKHATLAIWGVTLAAAVIAALATWGDGWASLGLLALLVPLWVGLFRTAGSVRGRETLAAVRRHRHANRAAGRYRDAFEVAQLRLRKAGDFGDWWRETCAAADSLDFLELELTSERRSGEPYALSWSRPEPKSREGPTVDTDEAEEPAAAVEFRQAIDVTLEVPQRRIGQGSAIRLAAKVLVGVNKGVTSAAAGGNDPRPVADLEAATRRVTWFGRLLADHGLARMDEPENVRWHKAHRARLAWDPTQGKRPPTAESFPAGVSADRPAGEPRVAIVHDFLYVYAGAEKVLEQMLEVFPHADLFSLIDFVAPADRAWLKHKPVTTSFIQRLPLARWKHRAYLPLMPLAIEQLDVTGYDVVLSSSYCVAKGVLTRPDQLHVCYCHSPVRFAWDLQHQYLAEAGIGGATRNPVKLLKNGFVRATLQYLRQWDARSANGVDVFLSNSDFVGRRIEKAYRRRSTTVYPPVDVAGFGGFGEKQGYYFTSSRMVPYKKIGLIVEAFTRTPERRLVVSGDGPEFERIKRLAGPNVQLVGHTPRTKFVHYMQRARAFVFAAEEDFGIVPVEAMACGTPVIGFGRGGVTETVVDGETGVHFAEQTPESLLSAVDRFEQIEQSRGWDSSAISRHAAGFGVARFRDELRAVVMDHWIDRRPPPVLQVQPRAEAPASVPSTNGHAPVEGVA